MNCKPSVNRFPKMVPEGGFEPPTRGFSILLKARFSAPLIVNRRKNRPSNIKYLAKAMQTVSRTDDPSRVKRLLTTITSQKPRFSAKPIVGIAAEMREALVGYTASLRP